MTAAAGVPEQPAAAPLPTDPATLLRSRNYLGLLLFAAILGVPISAAAYFFLQLVALLQRWVFTDLPATLGFAGEPLWWPVPPLVLAGVLVGLTIRYLPGRGGESPAEGFKAGGGPAAARKLPGIALAALASLSLGVVLGPEGPLIALGAGLAAAVFRLLRRDAPAQAVGVVGATGSFAAISTLLGSPLLGAFLLMEASGLGGPTLGLVLVPGLLAAGVGTVIFIGLDSLTGLGAVSLALPGLPPFLRPDIAQFGWALVIGVLAAVFGTGIRRLALALKPHVEDRLLLVTPVAGLVIGALAVGYTAVTAEKSSDVLFSGQDQLGPLLVGSAGYSVGALLLLLACKGLAYGVALGGFRGGPVFPSMYLGAAGGILLSHLPGLPMVPAAAMGIGAMCVTMLRLPFTSVLLATLLLQADGLAVTPLVIVAVVVAHVTTARLTPVPSTASSAGRPSTGPPSTAPTATAPPSTPQSALPDRGPR
ncbi:MAG TPA: chloride channel protein [Pseudonocardiaceae bacterium]